MIRIGIICPSEIAFRRFLPALQKAKDKIKFAAIGIASPEEWFCDLSNISQQQIDEQQASECAKVHVFQIQMILSLLHLRRGFRFMRTICSFIMNNLIRLMRL